MSRLSDKFRSASVKSLKSSGVKQPRSKLQIISKNPFEVSPAHIVFTNIQPQKDYQVVVHIRNLTKTPQRIRFTSFKNSNFSLQSTPKAQLAAGLIISVIIKYSCHQQLAQQQHLHIHSSDGFTQTLSINTYPKQANIIFQPFVNLGFVEQNGQCVKEVWFQNQGGKVARVKLESSDKVITVEPQVVNVHPKGKERVLVKYKPAEAGYFRGVIDIKSQEQLPRSFIQVVATSLEKARFIIIPTKTTPQQPDMLMDFRTVYAGQTKTLRAFLINNSPNPMKLQFILKKGVLQSIQQATSINTPLQQALQQKQNIFNLKSQTLAQAFSQTQLQISCQPQAGYKQKAYVLSYAMADFSQQGSIQHMKGKQFMYEKTYEYTLIVTSEEEKPMMIHLRAIVTCPEIKVNKKAVIFGDCLLGEVKRDQIIVQNRTKIENVTIVLPKIPYVDFVPNRFVVDALGSKRVEVLFRPKVIGKVDQTQLIIVNGIYEIPLRSMGIVRNERSMSQKQLTRLSSLQQLKPTIESPSKPFHSRKLSLIQSQNSLLPQNSSRTAQNQSEINLITSKKLLSMGKIEIDSRMGSKSVFYENKEKFSKLLTSRREEREKIKGERQVKERYEKIKDKLEKNRKEEKIDDEGLPQNPPVDIQFQLGSIKEIIYKHPKLPTSAQPLYVTKHIANHHPPQSSHKPHTFNHSPQDKPKRIFPSQPQSLHHRREIQRQLSLQQLQQVQVPETKIYMGSVYVKSQTTRYFWLRNSTRFAISCKVVFGQQEMEMSQKQPQAIPAYHQTAIPLTFSSHNHGDFSAQGYYIINNIYKYKLTVTAKVTEVLLTLNRESLRFEFAQNNLEFGTCEDVVLVNPGNSEARFKFGVGKDKVFMPKVMEGVVEGGQKLTVPIQLNLATVNKTAKKPSQLRLQQKLSLKILDGQQKSIQCTYLQQQPKFTVKCDLFTKPSTIFLNNELTDFIQIKNTTKQAIVLHLSTSGGLNLSNPQSKRLRIMPDETKRVKVKFIGDKVGEYKCGVSIMPRGGVKKDFQAQITVICPQLTFTPLQLHMQPLIVNSTKGQSFFSIIHNEPIPIPLIFDLRPLKYNPSCEPFQQQLQLQLLTPNQPLHTLSPTLRSQQSEQQNIISDNLVDKEIDIDEIEGNFSEQEDDEDETLEVDELKLRRYKVELRAGVEYRFRVGFVAKEVGCYRVKVPVEVEKCMKVQGPVVVCEAIQPKFLFEPANIDFSKKYLDRPERTFPKIVPITVANNTLQPIEWHLQTSQLQQQPFTFQPSSGHLAPNQSTCIKCLFTPLTPGSYSTQLPLYIKSPKHPQAIKFTTVSLKGTAQHPQLFFNKREVIMPVVPLGVESHTWFRVLNDGYDNLGLKCEFQGDVMGLGVKVSFPEGNTVGITKQKLRVDLSWKYDKPMSFTLMLTFTDDTGRKFTIPVSGTTDNSILTNYMYLLRNQSKTKVIQEGALQLIQLTANTTMTGSLHRKHSSHSLKSNSTNRSIMSYLGLPPINPYVLATTMEYIRKYLNENILAIPIGEFPQGVVETDGRAILEVMAVTSGKPVKFNWVYQGNSQGQDKVKKLMTQYTELIKLLKLQGAMLNHIRPQYLLSFHDLNTYLSTLPPQKSRCYMPNLLKINSGLYNYLSVQSWTTLLYQILKINLLSRVSQKNIRQHIPFYSNQEIPETYLQKSNFLSVSQSILLHWCEQAYHQVLLKEVRLMNFDKDFRNGLVIGAVIQRYAKNNLTARMVAVPKGQEDERKNAKVICDCLEEMGLLGHIEPKYIYSPFQREMILLLMYLYMNLPSYIPKQQPIVFKCILGQQIVKSIDLKNPSPKPLKFKAKYTGSPCYIPLSDQIFTIQPKSSYEFKIKFISKFVRQTKGRIAFVNIKDKTTGQVSSMVGSTIVFDLKSQTTEILSQKTWKVSSNLYEPSQYTIDIANNINAPQNTQFTLKVRTQYIIQKRSKAKPLEQPLPIQDQLQVILLKTQTVKVKKGAIEPLVFTYLPMSLHKTRTFVMFSNEFVGEFQHEIEATAEQPALTAEVRPSMIMYQGETYEWEYVVSVRNEGYQKVKKVYETLQARKVKAGSSPSKQKPKAISQVALQQKDSVTSKKFLILAQPNSIITLPQNTVTLCQPQNQKKPKDLQQQQPPTSSQNTIKMKFTSKQPVFQFPIKLTLHDPTLQDIRIYKLYVTILPKPLMGVLEMTTPLRKQLIQELPFVNNSDRDWGMKVGWFPGNGFALGNGIVAGFTVKRQSIYYLPVIFKPRTKQQSSAKLTITNPLTLDHFQYHINGHPQQPLSQGHIQIPCHINQPVTRTIPLSNPYQQKPIHLTTQTDIPNFSGPQKITIPANGQFSYTFQLTAMICGEFTYCLTFREVDGEQWFWFTVTVKTNSGSVGGTVGIEAEVRQRKVEKISVPVGFRMDKREEFEVRVKGQGLICPEKITLSPQGDNQITLQYLPLRVSKTQGSLYLVNPKVGQILIQLTLTCHPKPPTIFHLIKSPLGVGSRQHITLTNPTNSHVTVRYTSTNPQTFSVVNNASSAYPNPFPVAPYQQKQLTIEYMPGSIESTQKSEIVFFSQQIGQWQYHFSGIGIAPTEFQPIIVYREIGGSETAIVKFRNPFGYEIKVGVKLLVKEQWGNVLRLAVMGEGIVTVQAHNVISVPFMFMPQGVKQYCCQIRIMLSETIFWTFPIIAKGLKLATQPPILLKTPCRQPFSLTKHLHLQNLHNYNFNPNNPCHLTLLHIPEDLISYVDMFLKTDLGKCTLSSQKDFLTAEFLFKPMKPFKTMIDVAVDMENQGRWVYRLGLEATEPEVDDKIEIEANLMTTASVCFRITNTQKKTAEFKAYFTNDSAHQFSVQPSSGILGKYGSKGTQIKVSFTPVQYGKDKTGKLIIQTDRMYWSYKILGRLPKYIAPSKKQSIEKPRKA